MLNLRYGILDGDLVEWNTPDMCAPITIMLQTALTYWQGESCSKLENIKKLHSDALAGDYHWLAAEAGELL